MFRGSANFDKLLDKATSNLLLEPDWTTILQLCDVIRQGDIQPKYALTALKKKFYSDNPHVVIYSLQVLESWVKNCGSSIHQEVATKQFMEELKELAKVSTNESVKNKILELIQTWAHAFRNEPSYRAMQDTLNLMKVEGYNFPVLKESDAMFLSDTAPKWLDGDVCHRCRVPFSVVQRKHHCRNCGQVFCSKCSSHNVSIPRFGFEKEVRVCDACWESLNKPSSTTSKSSELDLPPEYLNSSLAQQPQVPASKNEQELQEEEELQLAIALSKSEAEKKQKEKLRSTSSLLSSVSTPAPVVSSAPTLENSFESNVELNRYLDRNYWEQKQAGSSTVGRINSDSESTAVVDSLRGPLPSAPSSLSVSSVTQNQSAINQPTKVNELHQNGEVDELDGFVMALCGNLEIFVNRMKSNSSRGRSIVVDSTVQNVFRNITAMHSQLLTFIQEQEEKRVYYESLQDKLSQAKDARAALDALREDHRERLRRAAEEAERQRQMQMAQKLEIMRKKKQEYLEYQRQVAMQRMQEQEREMQLRQEQQKQQYLRQVAGGVSGYQPAQPALPQGYSQPHTYGTTTASDSPVHGGGGAAAAANNAPGATTNPNSYHPQYHYSPVPGQQPFQPLPEYPPYNLHGLPNTPHALSRTDYQPQSMGPTQTHPASSGSTYQPQSSMGPPLNSNPSHHPPNIPTMTSGLPPGISMLPPNIVPPPPQQQQQQGPPPQQTAVGHHMVLAGGQQVPTNVLEAELICFD